MPDGTSTPTDVAADAAAQQTAKKDPDTAPAAPGPTTHPDAAPSAPPLPDSADSGDPDPDSDGDDSGTLDSDTPLTPDSDDPSAERPRLLAERANSAASDLLTEKARANRRERGASGRNATPEEKVLARLDRFQHSGYQQSSYDAGGGRIPVDDLKIGTSPDAGGEDVTVKALLGQTRDEETNSVSFQVEVENDDGTTRVIDDVPGDALAEAHMGKHAQTLSKMFKEEGPDGQPVDTAASKLVEWHANGGSGDPPVTEAELKQIDPEEIAAREGQKLTTADKLIEISLTDFRGKLKTLSEIPANQLNENQRAELKRYESMVGLLEAANTVPGPLGDFAKENALANVIVDSGDNVLPSVADAHKTLVDSRDSRTKAILSSLEGKISNEQMVTLGEMLDQKDPKALLSLLTSEPAGPLAEALHGNEEITKALLGGKDVSEVYTYLNQLAKSLPEDKKRELSALVTSGKVAGGLLLALLLLAGGVSGYLLKSAAESSK